MRQSHLYSKVALSFELTLLVQMTDTKLNQSFEFVIIAVPPNHTSKMHHLCVNISVLHYLLQM